MVTQVTQERARMSRRTPIDHPVRALPVPAGVTPGVGSHRQPQGGEVGGGALKRHSGSGTPRPRDVTVRLYLVATSLWGAAPQIRRSQPVSGRADSPTGSRVWTAASVSARLTPPPAVTLNNRDLDSGVSRFKKPHSALATGR